ncbi:NAD-dependent succinate-semialdehyde dehydrogenase [Flavobacterium cerinum]|uniref:NAD-dependent succinate-semialdehyde dehydrogenase n=1 Tax=Flavobacterium cerinum TaxID=2502784 RepID=A0ABY5IUD0_9FLAO|nr:NAD-dependent succinate-semialdehyde dehydrogenase [Flavobacterium cerinum]UUC46426.1 NAD-dependent succinate-semialdehyde dehydrogenase [Flavobacterium cerinum]
MTMAINDTNEKINRAAEAFQKWRKTALPDRITHIQNVKAKLLENKKQYAELISKEMGKPISQAIAEVEKCGLLCDYYIQNAPAFLQGRKITTEATESFVTYEPLGVLLGVMPWNFPFWQVFRFAIPSILAGNTIVLKHASNVPETAQIIQTLYEDAGLPKGIYQNLPISSKEVADVIGNPHIKAVSLTGSENAGIAVATEAAKHLKKSVLELGGSNAFIVCEDADLEKAVSTAVNARMQNAGQSCIAGKRFLIQETIYDTFLEKYKIALSQLKMGDPMDPDTQIGPMARVDLAQEVEAQVQKSVAMGATIAFGGNRNEAYFDPTIVTNITENMPVFNEEVFGPVAALLPFKTLNEAITISNTSRFGLGVSIFTKDINTIKSRISEFEEGAVFINEMVKSDPRLPFGGIKKSGYGRELSEEGIHEFVNIKTVLIQH